MPLESWDEAITEQEVGRDKRNNTEEGPERRKSRERRALQATFKEGAISCVCLGSRETGLGPGIFQLEVTRKPQEEQASSGSSGNESLIARDTEWERGSGEGSPDKSFEEFCFKGKRERQTP